MKLLRQTSTRMLVLVAAVTMLAAVAGSIAVGALGGSGPTPPAKPLAQALHDAATANEPAGITARITFTNNLFPGGALLGNVGSALMSGASGRLWLTNDGRGRLELQSNAGDVQIVWSQTQVTIFDASSNAVYRAKLPAKTADKTDGADTGAAGKQQPSVDEIAGWLTKLGQDATISGAEPSNVAGQAAYTVKLSPKHDGGLLGSAQLAWDAARGVPLRAAIYAQGASKPVLELVATDISYGPVPASDVDVTPPADAKVTDFSAPTGKDAGGSHSPEVTGVEAVRNGVPFGLVAPDTLVGLPRQTVRLVDAGDSKAALAVYGHGLGGLVVFERKADTAAANNAGPLGALPKVSIDGTTGHELATQLGTVLTFRRGGVDYVLAGSLPPAAAEAAARALR